MMMMRKADEKEKSFFFLFFRSDKTIYPKGREHDVQLINTVDRLLSEVEEEEEVEDEIQERESERERGCYQIDDDKRAETVSSFFLFVTWIK